MKFKFTFLCEGDTFTVNSKLSQKSHQSVLAMQRAKRHRLEQQRKKSIAAATEFGYLQNQRLPSYP